MKFSENWLREWVNPNIDTQTLVAQLTMAGLEVDSIEPVANDFSNVVVAEITAAEPHPNADKLQVCTVNDGTDTFQVVCGAPNARAGIKTAFARVGAVLPTPDGGTFKIKKAKLRQVESFGMICAEDELGISDNHAGIMELADDAPVGTDLRKYLQLDDQIIDIDLTPNRGDCLSITGLARETSVLNNIEINQPVSTTIAPTCDAVFPVSLQDTDGCPRYTGRIIRNINLSATTPRWMQNKLQRSGVRCIDPVVDITNYVLLELGQPMHAFDLDKLSKEIIVRQANQGERIKLLNDQDVELTSDSLLIADQSGAIAIAGIMGGSETAVTANTKHIFLESAFFNPIAIAGRARYYGLHTDSSHRFERGVDWQLQLKALERATELLLSITGGEAGPIIDKTQADKLPKPINIGLRHSKVNQMLAFNFPKELIENILKNLGLSVKQVAEGAWEVSIPSYRFDLEIEADLIEELARVYGYDNLPVKIPNASLPFKANNESEISIQTVRRTLIAMGYQETINYSFIDAQLQNQFDDQNTAIQLENPISAEMAVMRTSLWAGLVKTLVYNRKRQQQRIRLFENGQCFIKQANGEILQQDRIAGVICGNTNPESWHNNKKLVNFFDLKGDLEQLLELGGATNEFNFKSASHIALHPGQSACITKNGKEVGFIGALHPRLIKSLELTTPVFLFEINQTALTQGKLPKYEEISKFPESRRDLAFIIDEKVNFDEIHRLVSSKAGDFIKIVTLFDLYQGQHIEKGRKSFALGLTWQHHSRTLNDEEVNHAASAVISAMINEFDASLRD